MWAGVGAGVGVDFFNPESESIKFHRLRSPDDHNTSIKDKSIQSFKPSAHYWDTMRNIKWRHKMSPKNMTWARFGSTLRLRNLTFSAVGWIALSLIIDISHNYHTNLLAMNIMQKCKPSSCGGSRTSALLAGVETFAMPTDFLRFIARPVKEAIWWL